MVQNNIYTHEIYEDNIIHIWDGQRTVLIYISCFERDFLYWLSFSDRMWMLFYIILFILIHIKPTKPKEILFYI